MGVWAGQQVFSEYKDAFSAAIAINGTLSPIDDQYGIAPETIRATIDNFDEKGRKKFYQRMCRERKLLKAFLKHQPKRDLEDQKNELIALQNRVKPVADISQLYTNVIVATDDYIMPTRNQLQFWPEKRVKKVDGSHFLFYSFGSWDELLNGWLD
jgi:biotin synthesis protein BioG